MNCVMYMNLSTIITLHTNKMLFCLSCTENVDFRIKHAEHAGHNYFFSWEYDLTKDLSCNEDLRRFLGFPDSPLLKERFFLDNAPQQKILIKQHKIYSPPPKGKILPIETKAS